MDSNGSVLHDIFVRSGEVAYRFRATPPRSFEYISDSIAPLIGYTPAEYYAQPALAEALVHPDDVPFAAVYVRTAPAQGADAVLRWVRRDRSVIWTRQRLSVERDGAGKVVCVQGVVRQIGPSEAETARLPLIQRMRRAEPPASALPPARVLIADDHDLVRAGLRLMLAEDNGLLVAGEARTGTEATNLARALRPDLVLMDMRMPDGDGLEATRAIKVANPLTVVLILSMFDDVDLLLDAIKAGAAGYVLKAASDIELRGAIWRALAGDFAVDPGLARDVLQQLAGQHRRQPARRLADTSHSDPLSDRERGVLRLLARGQTNRQIGEQLRISAHTVKIHVEHILAKLEVSDRTQAAVRAIEFGYITT